MNILILTGAGISAESGLSTFRDNGGLWDNYPVEDVATPEAFAAKPDLVHRFYNERRQALSRVLPNPAHKALAALEAGLEDAGGKLTLITQNVDDLHERAGSRNILHMHGELTSIRCTSCEDRYHFTQTTYVDMICSACGLGVMRPDIVWFGEIPFFMREIESALKACNLFVSIGTSGAVYPAAGFVNLARRLGKDTLEINLEPSDGSHNFAQTRLGKAGELVPKWCAQILETL